MGELNAITDKRIRFMARRGILGYQARDVLHENSTQNDKISSKTAKTRAEWVERLHGIEGL